MDEKDFLKRLAVYKSKPDLVKDVSFSELADFLLAILEYVKKVNATVESGRLKGDKGDPGANAYNPLPDVDYLSLSSAQKKLDKALSKIDAEVQKALSKLQNGKDGRDAEVTKEMLEEAAKMALQLLELPDFRRYITEQPEAIRDSLELLQDDERLDASAIKGLEDLIKKNGSTAQMMVGGIRFLSQLADVRTTSLTNGDVLIWNSTTLQWENGPGGGAVLTDGDYGDITVGGSGTTMTIDNLAVTNAKVATGIDAVKIADGSITNTEFQYLNNVSSNIQTQLDAKLASTFTKAQLDTAVSDGNVLYVGDVTSNATHTGEVTGATALTVDKTAISNKSEVTAAVEDTLLIGDASDSNNLKKVTIQSVADLASGSGISESLAIAYAVAL